MPVGWKNVANCALNWLSAVAHQTLVTPGGYYAFPDDLMSPCCAGFSDIRRKCWETTSLSHFRTRNFESSSQFLMARRNIIKYSDDEQLDEQAYILESL